MELTEISTRIEKLEKQVHWQRLIIACICLMAMAAVVIGAAPQNRDAEFDTVTTKALVIGNGPGEMFALITGHDHGGFLAIYNNDRKPVAGIKADKNGGRLSIWNNAGDNAFVSVTTGHLISDRYLTLLSQINLD